MRKLIGRMHNRLISVVVGNKSVVANVKISMDSRVIMKRTGVIKGVEMS